MAACFLYGTLCHAPLLQAVLGREVATRPAVLEDHAVCRGEDGDLPVIVPQAGGQASGQLAEGLGAEDLARLDHYGFGYDPRTVQVVAGAKTVTARIYVALKPAKPAAHWSLSDWANRWAAIAVGAAEDCMKAFGTPNAAAVRARHAMLMVRSAARLRAQASASPATVRRNATAADVTVLRRIQPYANFFAVEEFDLCHSQFGGGQSPVLNRAVFVTADAATVLPYDPVRDRVLLVEQFRPGPFARGDRQPWQLEAIAGRIDPGEEPAVAAMREAVEEAGVTLTDLVPIAGYYPSPGGKTEYLYSFLGLADLPDHLAGLGGLADEGEDIRVHLLSFDHLMALIASGEVANAPLILSSYWLAARRDRLRAAAQIPASLGSA